MDYETYMKIVSSSDLHDWLHFSNEKNEEVFTYRRLLNIWFKEVSINDEEFEEPWAKKFPDPRAWRVYVYMYYCTSLVDVRLFVAVDGGRVVLPLPEIPERVREVAARGKFLKEELKPEEFRFIKKLDYKIARILNNDNERFGDYVSRFEIKDE